MVIRAIQSFLKEIKLEKGIFSSWPFPREKVALLKIDYMKYHYYSYEQRLKIFQLDTLQHRRLVIDLLECFKILKCKHSDPLYANFFPPSAPSSSRRGISFKYPRSLSDVTFNCFHNRVVRAWNSLPLSIRNLPSFPAFKRAISCLAQ